MDAAYHAHRELALNGQPALRSGVTRAVPMTWRRSCMRKEGVYVPRYMGPKCLQSGHRPTRRRDKKRGLIEVVVPLSHRFRKTNGDSHSV